MLEQQNVLAKQRAAQLAAQKQASANAVLAAGAKGYQDRKKLKQERVQSNRAAVSIQANFRGRKERESPYSEVKVRRERMKHDPMVKAETYIRDNNLMGLFDLLGQSLMSAQPADPRAFLVQELERLQSVGNKTSPMNFFSMEDIETLYSMYDVSKKGITPAQCSEALAAIGVEGVTVPQENGISLEDFKALLPL